MKTYDLIVLGGGAGGLVTAAGAASFGAKVALIQDGPLGGDCLWTGCIPSKSFLHAAKTVYVARQSNIFGMDVSGAVDFSRVKEFVKDAVTRISEHDDPARFGKLGIDVYNGLGSFTSPHEIMINEEEKVFGKRIVIATGSRPFIPPIPDLAQIGFVTNESILNMDRLPSRLLVIGGGPIGIEFAQGFSRLGTMVTIVEASKEILYREDQEIARSLRGTLESEGIQFMTGATVKELITASNSKKAIISQDGKLIELEVDDVFLATGRIPNTESLHLEAAGVLTERGYIKVDSHLRTSKPHIYAVGDVNGRALFTHEAGEEGKIAVSNAVLGLKRKVNREADTWVLFTDPEVFHLGLTEEEARRLGNKIEVFKTPLETVDRFVAEGNDKGLVKIITNSKGYILGAHAVGQDAGEFMQEVIVTRKWKQKMHKLSSVMHPYPTRSNAVKQTADLYWRKRLFDGRIQRWIKRYVRWFRG
ncbi:NAD(P)/FAD-dependent oxidoreductase [Ammoniphilus sp. CFH 90114]|uniref:dihydrolipoyl dehydrogenase family protein n=1 Tax=Ammoniphilus sp. CFH 90114 TaxID=2493665 RepID=UPI00100F10A7|nr:FAD-dependent oxidoreductase [Ammoniphilus sp. CFH 90114]RXT13733.1 pyridine nucleotide-disulfide oxidoreductase [Ammoniphilus sp. CFH 90114]